MTATGITFEDGYGRLQGIAERLNSDEVPVHEMCDLLAEGTGLHQALSTYLGEQKARVEAIERGEGVQPFRIVSPQARATEEERAAGQPRQTASKSDRVAERPGAAQPSSPTDLFAPQASAGGRPDSLGVDDDIPF